MKLAHRFCTNCGNGNPLLTVPRRRAVPAVKSAAPSYAPVADMETRRRAQWAAALDDPNPETRNQAVDLILKAYKGGDAA